MTEHNSPSRKSKENGGLKTGGAEKSGSCCFSFESKGRGEKSGRREKKKGNRGRPVKAESPP